MKHKHSTSLAIIIWAACVLVVLASMFFVYKIYSYDAEYRTISMEIQNVVNKDSRLSSVRDLIRDTEGPLFELNKLFVSENTIPDFVGSIENLGDREGISVVIGSLNLNQSSIKGVRSKELKVRVSASGSWKTIVSFVTDIETLPYALVVDRLTLSSGGIEGTAGKGRPSDLKWNTDIDMRVFVTSPLK